MRTFSPNSKSRFASKELNDLEQLDAVLECVIYCTPDIFTSSSGIEGIMLLRDIRVNKMDLESILLHHLKTGLISNNLKELEGIVFKKYEGTPKERNELIQAIHEWPDTLYFATWDGLIFYHEGGYYGKHLADVALTSRTKKMEDDMQAIQNRMAKWTKRATIVAFLILFVETVLCIAAFAAIAYDHPDAFPWIWCN